jgi:hypothetical protein
VRRGDVVYTHDKDGNMLSEAGRRYRARYAYSGMNRMVYSEVRSEVQKTLTVSGYGYDALGRLMIIGIKGRGGSL